MQIEFAGEAYETFQRVVASMSGLVVKITTRTVREGALEDIKESFDAVLIGPDHHSEWGDAVRYRDFDEEASTAIGPEKSVRAERISVY
jgi:hypothetical protein